MKLLTKEIAAQLPGLYRSSQDDQAVAYLKLFNPTGLGTWYITEYDPEEDMAFGLCVLQEAELGYVSLAELREYRGRFGLGIERDIHWTPKTLAEIRNNGG